MGRNPKIGGIVLSIIQSKKRHIYDVDGDVKVKFWLLWLFSI